MYIYEKNDFAEGKFWIQIWK